jgi:hypothetical protein
LQVGGVFTVASLSDRHPAPLCVPVGLNVNPKQIAALATT